MRLRDSRFLEQCCWIFKCFNPLTPNDPSSGRTAPLTSKRCILYIYSTNIGTEYFKHGIYSPFFFSSKCSLFHNSNVFGSCFIHILYTGCAKILKSNSGAKRLSRSSQLAQRHSVTCQKTWFFEINLSLWIFLGTYLTQHWTNVRNLCDTLHTLTSLMIIRWGQILCHL